MSDEQHKTDSANRLALAMSMGIAEVREKYIKLPFAWPGGKGEHLKKILPHIPYGCGYGEPFGGSGAVLLNREPIGLEVLNDRYSGITDFFRVVREPKLYKLFMERITCTVHSREEFIWCKKTWFTHDDPVERAARWYYMIRYAVNCKPNSTFGRSTDPVVRFADRLHKSLPLFGPLHWRLRTVTMENQDWRQCIDDFDRVGWIWYFDPTYLDCVPGTYDEELSEADHRELAMRVRHMHSFVAMSSYSGPKTLAIYEQDGLWDEVIRFKRTSRANTQREDLDSGRVPVDELLWIRKAR